MNRAVFLDRDGTIIEDKGYLSDPGGVVILPGAAAGLKRLQDADFLLVVISNQSAVGRGMCGPADVEAVNRRMTDLLSAEGIAIADIRYCPHTPDADCGCRKPRPGLILEAASAIGADLAASAMVGDKDSDVRAGEAAGCGLNLRVGAEEGALPGLEAAAQAILAWAEEGGSTD